MPDPFLGQTRPENQVRLIRNPSQKDIFDSDFVSVWPRFRISLTQKWVWPNGTLSGSNLTREFLECMLWKKLKEVLPKKQKSIPNSKLSPHGENIDNPTDIVNTLNENLSTIAKRMAVNDPPCEPEKDDNTHAPICDSLDDEYIEEFVRKQNNIINVSWENNRSGWHKC